MFVPREGAGVGESKGGEARRGEREGHLTMGVLNIGHASLPAGLPENSQQAPDLGALNQAEVVLNRLMDEEMNPGGLNGLPRLMRLHGQS